MLDTAHGHPPDSANPDGISFDELLNELHALEVRCQTIHTSIENKDPMSRRQTLALKQDIYQLRKTIEKQGIA